MQKKLKEAIESKKSVVGIVGLGYVGLPLAIAFEKSGLKVVGFDISESKIKQLLRNQSYIDDISNQDVKDAFKAKRFTVTSKAHYLKKVDCIIICVPTPLSKTKEPDMTYVLSAVRTISKNLQKGQLVVLESTTYPGTTEEEIAPIISELSKLKVGKDIYLGFSPERVDPANHMWTINEIPKVVGGVNSETTNLMKALYSHVFDEVVVVSNCKSAEMVKMLENTFRSVNIGLINEMAMICNTLGVNIWEVIDAAKTKPFGYMPFYPGPGIGGHCINIDSMYLAWKSRLHGYEPRLIELAQLINDQMPKLVVDRAIQILKKRKKIVDKANILVLGVSYKKNVSDTRESPALSIMEALQHQGAKTKYHDPFVPTIKVDNKVFRSTALTVSVLKKIDLVLILTGHDGVDYRKVIDSGVDVFDTRNVLQGIKKKGLIHYL